MKEAIYTVEQIDSIVDMITHRFVNNPDNFQVKVEYETIRVEANEPTGKMYISVPEGPLPSYIQLFLGDAHSWTKLNESILPFVNYKTRKKVKQLGDLFRRKNDFMLNKAEQDRLEEMRQTGYASFMKAFPEITDLLLEGKDGKGEEN